MSATWKEEYQEKGRECFGRMLSSRKLMFASLAFMLLMLFTASNALATVGTGFGENFDKAGNDALTGLACALNGALGWLLIAFGVLLALWDFFIQKQGHFLILAVVGVLGVIVLAKSIPIEEGACD